MAHIRRKFVDVLQSQGLAVSEAAIPRIAELYAVEKDARCLQPEERVRLHQSRSKSLPDDLEIWTTAQVAQIASDHPSFPSAAAGGSPGGVARCLQGSAKEGPDPLWR
ncbi:transposase [Phaeobacter inhibens]|nr:transposase [Phaeobacter inhibens]MDO6756804.1 transposase [Phaeobacter inhibens]